MTINIVLDTSVWLGLAGDFRSIPLIKRMGAMMDGGDVAFIIPDIVQTEFDRNRARVLKAATTSQTEIFKRVRNAIKQFGVGETKDTIQGVLDVEHKMALHGDAAVESMRLVEDLMKKSEHVVASIFARARAANRGLEFKAPFIGNSNDVADAVIFEVYAEMVEEAPRDNGDDFAFICANTNDFGDVSGDKRNPHPDIAAAFDGKRSKFSVDVASFFKDLLDSRPFEERVDDMFEDLFFEEEPRLLSDITEAISLLHDQVWFIRQSSYLDQVDAGEIEVVDQMPADKPYDQAKVTRGNLSAFRAANARVRERYKDRPEVLGPFEDFDWGMINGKLSALRWVLGEEWDFLDT